MLPVVVMNNIDCFEAMNNVGCFEERWGGGELADEALRKSGLERAAALEKDIAWFEQEYGLKPAPITDSSPGRVYARCFPCASARDAGVGSGAT